MHILAMSRNGQATTYDYNGQVFFYCYEDSLRRKVVQEEMPILHLSSIHVRNLTLNRYMVDSPQHVFD